MVDKEQVINELLLKISTVVDNDNLAQVRNSISSVLYNYDLNEKTTEVGFYTGDANKKIIEMYKVYKTIEGTSEKTLAKYEFDLTKLFEFLNKDFHKIEITDIRYFMAKYKTNNGKCLSNTTMDNMRKTYSAFFNWCAREGYIERSPMNSFGKIKRDTIPEPAFTVEEMESMLFVADNIRDKTLLYFLQATGLRVSEVSELDVTDIDWINKTITVKRGKGGYSHRIVPLDDRLVFLLKKYFSYRNEKAITSIALFTKLTKKNERLAKSGIEDLVKRIAAKAGVENAHPHRYRTTFITSLLTKGMKIEDVQILAGHKDIRTTVGYNRSNLSDIQNIFNKLV